MTDDYASHLPILEAFVNLLKPERVLEFGAGSHSTPFFLRRPEVKRLLSIEADPLWFDRLAVTLHNRKLELVQSADPDLSQFDLIFIDDGKVAAEREQTIRWVLGQDHPPVVIHDAEVPEYRKIIRELAMDHSMIFCLASPNTALIWPEGWEQDRLVLGQEVSRCAP